MSGSGDQTVTNSGSRPDSLQSAEPGDVIQVCFPSLRAVALDLEHERPELGRGHIEFTLMLEITIVDHRHVSLEAWVLNDQRRSVVQTKTMHSAQIVMDGQYFHCDLFDDEQDSILQLSIHHASGRVYARTRLIHRAGFQPGSTDPPKVLIHPVAHEAQSA